MLTDHISKFAKRGKREMCSFRFMPNAFRILKPIQKSSKCVWVFRSTGANAFAKNQTRLAYEDKRDLYCITVIWLVWDIPVTAVDAWFGGCWCFRRDPGKSDYSPIVREYPPYLGRSHFVNHIQYSGKACRGGRNRAWISGVRGVGSRDYRSGW